MSGKVPQETNSTSGTRTELRYDFYRAIFSNSREPIAIIDRQGVYLESRQAEADRPDPYS